MSTQTDERALESYVKEILAEHGGWKSAIATYLDTEPPKMEEPVERPQEYRTALITTAVTGKIDVRGNAPIVEP